jgi:hypothetical protein
MSPPFSGPKDKPNNKPAWSRYKVRMTSCLAYFSTWKMEATFSSESSVEFQRTTAIYRRKKTRHGYFCCILWLPLNILSHSFSLYALRNQDVMQCCIVRAEKESRIVCLSTEIPLSVTFAWSLNSTDLQTLQTEARLHSSDWNNFSYYILWSSWIFSVI